MMIITFSASIGFCVGAVVTIAALILINDGRHLK